MTATLLHAGRHADVWALDDRRVLRRTRQLGDVVAHEVDVMRHARRHGFPVPEVLDESGTDVVLERVVGPSMLEDLVRHPTRVREHARMLADLLTRLQCVPAPSFLDRPLGAGDALLHLDLHPRNVLLGEHGPVVVDWSNAAGGPGAADVANTWLILATGDSSDHGRPTGGSGAIRHLLVDAFLAHVDRDAASAALATVIEHRLRDAKLPILERRELERFEVGDGSRRRRRY